MYRRTSQRVTITLDKSLLKMIDNLARYDYASRSDVIRQAIAEYMRDSSRRLIADPDSIATDKMYEAIKEKHPYLSPNDSLLIHLVYNDMFNREEEL